MREELVPLQAQFEEAGQPSREAWRALGEHGLLGVSTPAELGGVGGSFLDEMILCEEMCYAFVGAPAVPLHKYEYLGEKCLQIKDKSAVELETELLC